MFVDGIPRENSIFSVFCNKMRTFFCIFQSVNYNAVPPFLSPVAVIVLRPAFFLLLCCLLCISPLVFGDLSDCLWGGSNEETTYSPTFVPGLSGISLAQYQSPLGAPQPAIPIQATPATRAMDIPQANIPTITIPAGPVGSVGQPATFSGAVAQAPPGTQIVYVMPTALPGKAVICVDGTKTIPATEAKVVSATTPGAIPVALRTVMVRRPKVEYHWTYAPVETKMETLVKVVDPRSGRVVRTYCQTDAERTHLPWLHRREVITYEMVEAKVAIPVSVSPTAASATNTLVVFP
jgi:hypothetical protein